MKLKYFGTLACNAEKCWDVFCSFLLHQSAPSFNAQLGQWHLKLSCIDKVGQRSISTIDKPSIGHSYELWLLVTFMSHQNHRSPAWDPDATVFESLPCHPCPSMIHRTSTVHLYTVYLIFFTMIAFASFCSVFGLLPLAFNIFNGHHQMSTVWNDFGYLWIKSWHRRLFDAETKTRASRAALLTRGFLASQLGSDQKWHRRTKGIKKTVKTLYLLDHISIL